MERGFVSKSCNNCDWSSKVLWNSVGYESLPGIPSIKNYFWEIPSIKNDFVIIGDLLKPVVQRARRMNEKQNVAIVIQLYTLCYEKSEPHWNAQNVLYKWRSPLAASKSNLLSFSGEISECGGFRQEPANCMGKNVQLGFLLVWRVWVRHYSSAVESIWKLNPKNEHFTQFKTVKLSLCLVFYGFHAFYLLSKNVRGETRNLLEFLFRTISMSIRVMRNHNIPRNNDNFGSTDTQIIKTSINSNLKLSTSRISAVLTECRRLMIF